MTAFTHHTVETGPNAAKPLLSSAEKPFGFIPGLQRVIAECPALSEDYMALWSIFEKSSLSYAEQQVVYLTADHENECYYCMAGHTGLAKMVGVPDDAVTA